MRCFFLWLVDFACRWAVAGKGHFQLLTIGTSKTTTLITTTRDETIHQSQLQALRATSFAVATDLQQPPQPHSRNTNNFSEITSKVPIYLTAQALAQRPSMINRIQPDWVEDGHRLCVMLTSGFFQQASQTRGARSTEKGIRSPVGVQLRGSGLAAEI